MANTTPWEQLREMLRDRAGADEAARPAIDEAIRARFAAHRAILITDMHGFSRITDRHGIVHFLGLLDRVLELCEPIIAAHGGSLLKTIGDDLFVSFADPRQALRCAMSMWLRCSTDSEGRAEDERVSLSFGLGWGEVLDLDGTDLYGEEVNRASKLGEDIAAPGEILISEAAAAALEGMDLKGWWMEERRARISAISLRYWAVLRAGTF